MFLTLLEIDKRYLVIIGTQQHLSKQSQVCQSKLQIPKGFTITGGWYDGVMIFVFQELFCQKCLDKGMYHADKAPQDSCKKCRKPKYFQKHLAYCEVKCTEYSPDEVTEKENSFYFSKEFREMSNCVWHWRELELS